MRNDEIGRAPAGPGPDFKDTVSASTTVTYSVVRTGTSTTLASCVDARQRGPPHAHRRMRWELHVGLRGPKKHASLAWAASRLWR